MSHGEMVHGRGAPMGPMPQASPLLATPMDMAALSQIPDPAAMQAMARQLGPAGMVMMNITGMMGQMLMTMQGMAGMITALQMQQMKLKQQGNPGARQMQVHLHQHPDAAPPQWDYCSPKSVVGPNSPPPYRAQGGSHW